MKISRKTRAQIVAMARSHAGYSGDGADFELVKSALSDAGVADIVIDGKTVAIKALVVEQTDPMTVVVRQVEETSSDASDDGKSEPDEDAEGDGGKAGKAGKAARGASAARAKARSGVFEDVDASREATGSDVRKAITPPTDLRVVGSAEEVMWKRNRAKGKGFFSEYRLAKAWEARIKMGVANTRGYDGEPAYKAASEQYQRYMGKTYSATSATLGSALLEQEFIPDIIDNAETYGFAMRLGNVVSVSSGSVRFPRIKGEFTMQAIDDGTSATRQTSVTFEPVELRTRILRGHADIGNQLLSESAIDVAEQLAERMARALAKTFDNTVLNGDGTSNGYIPGRQGILPQFGTTPLENVRSVIGGTTMSGHSSAQIHRFLGKLGSQYRQRPSDAVILCSEVAKHVIFQQLAANTQTMNFMDFQGNMVSSLYGHPIVTTPLMNETDDSSAAIDVLFGTFSRVFTIVMVGSPELSFSTHSGHLSNTTDVRLVANADVLVHDVGSTTEKGPVVALYQQS